MVTPTPGVLIDSCVPRSQYQRCVAVYTWLISMTDDWHEELDPGHEWQRVFDDLPHDDSEAADDVHVWNSFEDGIIGQINRLLPDDLICTVGEFSPGDVIIREVGPDDLEPGPVYHGMPPEDDS